MAIVADITASDEWHESEDKTINISVKQADGTTAQTMTGWTLTWVVYTNRTAGTTVLTKSGASITLANDAGTDDQAQIAIADTDAITEGYYYHELRRTDAGNASVLAYGDVRVLPSAL